MESEAGAALSVSLDTPAPVPAGWLERVADGDWCPETLRSSLDEAFLQRAMREPGVLHCETAQWHVAGAAVRGRSHAHRAEYRDDALAADAQGDLLVLAVADGAGSSALSRIGAAVTAQLTVERTIARYRAVHDDGGSDTSPIARLGHAMAHAVHDAAIRLHALASTAEVSPATLRTTLILVAIGGDVMLVSQVGDGAVLIARTDGSVVRVGATRESAWAGEVTCFVPDACAMTQAAALRQASLTDVTLIALMTDGVDDPFHPLEQTGAALVAQWCHGTTASLGAARQPECGPVLHDREALLRWLSFEQRGEVDDRTLLLAVRESPGAT